MARGGRDKRRDAPERRCIATGVSGETDQLIRFVADPDGRVTPDLAEKLPGRGAWVSADRASLELALRKRLFARSLKAKVEPPAELVELVEALLLKRAVASIALCRKAGAAFSGFEKVRVALETAPWAGPEGGERAQGITLLQAVDGSEQGRRKLSRMAPPEAVLTPMTGAELGLAFGRAYVIHAALVDGGAARNAIRDLRRLSGVRNPASSA